MTSPNVRFSDQLTRPSYLASYYAMSCSQWCLCHRHMIFAALAPAHQWRPDFASTINTDAQVRLRRHKI